MRIALLIQVHKLPAQVGRLVKAITHPDIDIYLNVDLKSDISEYREECPGVNFINRRTDVRWGGISQVEATLRGMGEIDAHALYDYIFFLSGQDYPLVAPSAMLEEVAGSGNVEYLCWTLMGNGTAYERRMRRRYDTYHVEWGSIGANKTLDWLTERCGVLRRPLPFPGAYYKGSSWWNLTGGCVRYILDLCRENPRYLDFYRNTRCPDEHFFQAVVLSSPFRENVLNENKRYVDWSGGGANPKILTIDDLLRITGSGCWFARKFDPTVDSAVLDRIDENISPTK